jgi:ubiquinone/menaquinone biosynthesis C-methylase UbiE
MTRRLRHYLKNLIDTYALKDRGDLTAYWKKRARRYGRRSVLDLTHPASDFDLVTESQRKTLLPLLEKQLLGSEKTILDFGCGPGRFTGALADLIDGHATGVDITEELIDLAPPAPGVAYLHIGAGKLPFPDASFDIAWSCLVLGGISDDHLCEALAEIRRVLAPGGLFFFIENTASTNSAKYYWFYRDESTYINLADFCAPTVVGRYYDLGQRITVFCGRKAK